MQRQYLAAAAAVLAIFAMGCKGDEATPNEEIKKAVKTAVLRLIAEGSDEKFAGDVEVTKIEVIQHYGDSRRSARDAGTTYVIQATAAINDGPKAAVLTGRFKVFVADSDKWTEARPERESMKIGPAVEPTPTAAPPRLSLVSRVPEEALRGWAEAVGTDVDATTKYPTRIRRTKDKGEMVLIPAGTFQMGAVPGDAKAEAAERPRHAVTLSSAYYMDVSEVTVDQWKLYVASGNGRMPADLPADTPGDSPIFYVDHGAASEYAAWVGATLPTEAQWERAAKGGKDDNVYPWGKEDVVELRYAKSYPLVKVRSFPPNAYGLYDMAGNACEWCADCYDPAYYRQSPDTDPAGPAKGDERAVRSGTSSTRAVNRASARWGWKHRGVTNMDLSFRLVRSL